jgi:hypothetical protein
MVHPWYSVVEKKQGIISMYQWPNSMPWEIFKSKFVKSRHFSPTAPCMWTQVSLKNRTKHNNCKKTTCRIQEALIELHYSSSASLKRVGLVSACAWAVPLRTVQFAAHIFSVMCCTLIKWVNRYKTITFDNFSRVMIRWLCSNVSPREQGMAFKPLLLVLLRRDVDIDICRRSIIESGWRSDWSSKTCCALARYLAHSTTSSASITRTSVLGNILYKIIN